MKKNKIFVVITVILVIILTTLSILLATGMIALKQDSTNDNKNNNVTEINNIVTEPTTNYQSGNPSNQVVDTTDYIKFEIDNENKKNRCLEISNNNYYSYGDSYEVIINNINIKNSNYRYRYVVNEEDRVVNVYLNDINAFSGKKSEALLIDVCNYGNYLMYSVAWESPRYYRIIDTNGNISMEFRGKIVDYDNGLLYVEELNTNATGNKLMKYQLDMNSDNLQKLNITTED